MDKSTLDNIYKHHPPSESQRQRYEWLRGQFKSVALTVNDECPESREKALALTSLQQALMWANAAIAINE